MPFIPHTPESLVARADSKNPATTCKGITSNGRSCRRALAASTQSSPNAKQSPRDGVVAFISKDGADHEGAAAFFCWQHKEQAESLAAANYSGRKSGVVRLQDRTSLDTLVDRLGLLEVEDHETPTRTGHRNERTRPAKKERLPKNWQNVPGPLLSIPVIDLPSEKSRPNKYGKQKSRPSSNLIFSFSCCTTSSEPNEPMPAPVQNSGQPTDHQTRRAKMPSSVRRSEVSTPTPAQKKQHVSHIRNPSAEAYLTDPAVVSSQGTQVNRPSFARDPPSRTQEFLALMPKTLSPQTTSLLLAELAKPISDFDEPGYIYMFWLTPGTSPAPTHEATTSLLTSPEPNRPSRTRRTTDIIREYNPSSSPNKHTILLKIGRAANVQRRMNEWSRQCNHNLSVLRYYPYLPSSSQAPLSSPYSSSPTSSSDSPRKVPHAHKIERLIHLELAHLRVKRGCAACGKEHREWFEVDGRRESVEEVDRVVRRWVDYGMGT